MKTRFSTIDIVSILNELQKYIGMRVNQVYDIDNKTYLIRLNRYEEKVLLLMESGVRIHTTEFEWPKNPSPSGFSMKLRKHIKNKRLEHIKQLGMDRIVDLQFGINDAAYHVILELYDRGNIALTDFEHTILNILRPRSDESNDVKLFVREKYPFDSVLRQEVGFDVEAILFALEDSKSGDSLKKILMPRATFGPALLDHVLSISNFPKNCQIGKDFKMPEDVERLVNCLKTADELMKEMLSGNSHQGYIIHKVEKSKDGSEMTTNVEFHPYLFQQVKDARYTEYPSFDKAVDNFFSSMEGQKIDLKAFQKEKEALKKLENVKKDHELRLSKLHESQSEDAKKAQLIEVNLELVDKAIMIIRSAIANQISWAEIQDLVKEAQLDGDPVAKAIKKLKLDINHFTLLLTNNQADEGQSKSQLVDIDLQCSAYANARKYYDMKRSHARKEQKTIESSATAFKNAEKKTRQALKEVAITTSITKARKVLWFEKFFWFISSENYLVLAGRDIQQNEMLVKRYLKGNDLYVHADLHGASSIVIKNPKGGQVPPKTLNESGTMAICNSSAWDAKIVTSAWWVYANQVSKTAPSGEYLTAGSFMIRGKKNYLTPAYLVMGFGFMFKLDEESISNHAGERCVKAEEDDIESVTTAEVDNEISAESDSDDSTRNSSNSLKPFKGIKGTSTNIDLPEVISAAAVNVKATEFIEDTNNLVDAETDGAGNIDNEASNIKDFPDTEQSIPEADVVSNTESGDDTEDDDIEVEASCDGDDSPQFPDTEIKLQILGQIAEEDIKEVKSGDIIIQQHKMITKNVEKVTQANGQKEKQPVLKRRQKGKMKKIKEKYKYQDEEERQLRLQILTLAGQTKPEKKKKAKKLKKQSCAAGPQKPKSNPNKHLNFIHVDEENTVLEVKNISAGDGGIVVVPAEDQNAELEDVSDDEEVKDSEEVQLLNSLTGCPTTEDTLLYAVPVCAPYSCVLNYKYKVKVIPGSSRRGKAAKTALNLFMQDKSISQREKDLLRSVKDQDISRNLPGKIKLSTTNYKKAAKV